MGDPVNPTLVANKVLDPAVDPKVQLTAVAIPAESVVEVSLVTLPPPEATAKVIGAPETGLSFISVTKTLGAIETAVPA